MTGGLARAAAPLARSPGEKAVPRARVVSPTRVARVVTTRPTAASAAAARHASFVVRFDSSLRLPQGSILHHVRKRYKSNLIYTLVGSILVAVNPFQRLDIYTEVRSFARNGSR